MVARITSSPPVDPSSFIFRFPTDFASAIFSAPALMTMHERLLLYTLVVSLQPARVLELGSYYGGSTLIMVTAMDGINKGHIFAIDPEPQFSSALEERLASRLTMHRGTSPESIPTVASSAAGPFEFAFVDANHEYGPVVDDFVALLPFMADGSYILFHDAYYSGVRRAIDAVLQLHGDKIIDCGVISRSGGSAEEMYWPVKESIPNYEEFSAGSREYLASRNEAVGGLRLVYYEKSINETTSQSRAESNSSTDVLNRSISEDSTIAELRARIREQSQQLNSQASQIDSLLQGPPLAVTLRGLRQLFLPLGSHRFELYKRMRGKR